MEGNRLGLERSPYLLQHKDNPVHWYAWGDEAFAAARREQKPIFLSIGYSTCYWCHVMEKDSFETQEAADVLNAHFIAIKVDREERPDIDQLYMQAVMSLTGHGGWPMSVFLTPDLEPFWGGTFFYRQQFIQILQRVHEVWSNERDKVSASAKAIAQFLGERDSGFPSVDLDEQTLRAALGEYAASFDSVYGGFGAAPKFPPAAQLSLLLRLYRRFNDGHVKEMAITTLAAMARGGIYDHIGGGFHRYSTDEKWLVPHFEKMLYDNALLAVSYLEAAQLFKLPMFSAVAREILNYLLRDMHSPDGAFYTAEDAGDVGREGEFYVWKFDELEKILSESELESLQASYRVAPQGNFEHATTILALSPETSWEERTTGPLGDSLKALFEVRGERRRPHRDDKILSGWNGLALQAFCKGYQVLRDHRYLEAARGCAKFLRERMFVGGELLRRYREGEARISGTLEDYAYVIEGLLSLYESDFDVQWLTWAKELQGIQDQRFWDTKDGGYYFSDSPELLQRRKEFIDGATPSGNSVAALNCLRLYAFFGEKLYLERGAAVVRVASGLIAKYPSAFPKSLQALDFMLDRGKEIVIIRSKVDEVSEPLVMLLQQEFLPNDVWMMEHDGAVEGHPLPLVRGKHGIDGKTAVYICEEQTCRLPLTDYEEIKKQVTHVIS